MLKIGDFSRLSRVSVRMLRYYDERQLDTIGRIVALKEMGFGVSSIRELLDTALKRLRKDEIMNYNCVEYSFQRIRCG